MSEIKRVFFVSLGCAKNLVDSEHMLGLIASRGDRIEGGLEEAQTAVINTCAFIQEAVEEAIDTILDFVRLKGRGKLKEVFVAGCLVQRYGYKLAREIPEVDGWLGTGKVERIADLIHQEPPGTVRPFLISRPGFVSDKNIPRVRTTPPHTSYLKIAEGCSNACTYCIIPALRGPLRSRAAEDIVEEAKEMFNQGVKEINLVAQDTTMYGRDLRDGSSLESLLERLVTIGEGRWIRLLYCHPDGISEGLLDLISSEEVVCPYIDLPFQHVNEHLLAAMGRAPKKGASPRKMVERVRSFGRDISLRTTFMTGFPGETDEIFEELYDFVAESCFEHMGAFIFSPEKGSPAERLGPRVERHVSRKRLDRLMELQSRISAHLNSKTVGHRVPVLLEGFCSETDLLLQGRTAGMAPDTDCRVLINRGMGSVGQIEEVLITEAHPYDLIGEIVS